jgi:hypothetical protein
MSDPQLIILGIFGVAVAAAVPLAVYAKLPKHVLKLTSKHSQYSGLGASDRATPPSGNKPLPDIGSLQLQTA